MIELLLEYGANIDVQDMRGWTPLHKAADNKTRKLSLLNHGADPQAQTNNGKTPIQLANEPYWLKSEKEEAQNIRISPSSQCSPAKECGI